MEIKIKVEYGNIDDYNVKFYNITRDVPSAGY
jgi:hypothetical protein